MPGAVRGPRRDFRPGKSDVARDREDSRQPIICQTLALQARISGLSAGCGERGGFWFLEIPEQMKRPGRIRRGRFARAWENVPRNPQGRLATAGIVLLCS